MQSIAILLNANARLVTDKVRRSLERIIPRASLFLSHTKEEARDYVKHIVDNKFNVIFSGGGDGSFVNLINLVRDYISKKNTPQAALTLPQFGVLKLGTGNGISSFVGSSGGTKLLERALHAEHLDTMEMALIERDNRIFHFAGSGFDARIAADYQLFMNSLKTPAARKQFSGLFGYFCAGLGKTVPESVIRPDRGEVRIELEGDSTAYHVAHRRGTDTPVETQRQVLYSGPSTAVAVATEPYYGYNVRAFPFANLKEGYMNLRVLMAKPVSVVANMGQYWNGSYRGKDVLDFLVKKIRVTYEKATPMHIGGDFEQMAHSITYRIFPQTCSLIDFHKLAHA
ncbi:MAG: hypothetical protein JNJ69_19250 [Leptospiraceae bacterium]|nr:hypothetical protein [Leptospiraceae bacterium]